VSKAAYRGSGSIGILAAMRTSMLIGKHPHDESQRVLAMVKTNVGTLPRSLAFQIEERSGQPCTCDGAAKWPC
jgi:hypothetical protein